MSNVVPVVEICFASGHVAYGREREGISKTKSTTLLDKFRRGNEEEEKQEEGRIVDLNKSRDQRGGRDRTRERNEISLSLSLVLHFSSTSPYSYFFFFFFFIHEKRDLFSLSLAFHFSFLLPLFLPSLSIYFSLFEAVVRVTSNVNQSVGIVASFLRQRFSARRYQFLHRFLPRR